MCGSSRLFYNTVSSIMHLPLEKPYHSQLNPQTNQNSQSLMNAMVLFHILYKRNQSIYTSCTCVHNAHDVDQSINHMFSG